MASGAIDAGCPRDRPVIVVDGANVVGSVPDGWWRDRKGAATRLRDKLESLSHNGFAGVEGPVAVILVVEGQARGIGESGDVRVVDATGSGDDAIVDVVEELAVRDVTVVTSDRALRSRVEAAGARTVGSAAVPR